MLTPRTSRRAGGAPTLSDVARLAGVSPMTVSRVITGEATVRELTQAKVHAAIATLNYVPNRAARLLAGGGQCRLALIYGNPSSAYLSEVLVGALAECGPAHIQLQLEQFEETETLTQLADRMAAVGVDGVILPPPYSDNRDLLSALSARGVAVAILASGDPAATAHALSIDDLAAAHDMTRHLIARGHRRIGFIAGNRDQTASAKRRDGYLAAMREAGLSTDASLIAEGDFTYRSGMKAAERLLDRAEPLTAIFASNDDMAAGVIAVAHRRHLEIPGDLSVCGFDDTAIATTISPELTTVRQPIAAMARAAVRALVSATLAKARDAETPKHQVFGHEIISREST